MRRLNARQCHAAVSELARIAEDVDGELGLTASGPVTLDLDSSVGRWVTQMVRRRVNVMGSRLRPASVATHGARGRVTEFGSTAAGAGGADRVDAAARGPVVRLGFHPATRRAWGPTP
jgi:hypothetical protein